MELSAANIKKTCCVFLLVLCFMLVPFLSIVSAEKVHEDHVKAVFLYNLTHFVHWPVQPQIITGKMQESLEDKMVTKPFVIGVAADKDFVKTLQLTVASEVKNGHPILVNELDMDSLFQSELKGVAILYFDKASLEKWEQLRPYFKGYPVLTVSNSDTFTKMGGMVSLVRQKKNIRIEVNYNLVQQAGLKMSAKLLRLAKIVE